MPIPLAVTRFNRDVLNRFMVHLTGHGWFVELEHRGRASGRTYRVPMMAFDGDGVVTIALTYGPKVDWLRNVRAAGGGRMHLGHDLVTLGPPTSIDEATGLARMPQPPRAMLPLLGCHEYVELPVLRRESFTGW